MFDYEYRSNTQAGRISFEISLKPFGRAKSEQAYEEVARHLFTQWKPLLKYADACSVLFWTSDGSEILDYSGNLEDTFEWCQYIGIGNWNRETTLEQRTKNNALHSYPIHYIENPPEMSYSDLKTIISIIKRVGKEITGFDITVGETFDPGPEFAWSEFKFNRHPEITRNHLMGGVNRWVHCASKLHADERKYAAYPDGIPEGTHLGEFLGRQFMALKRDVGFDYIWLSNGFGFSLASWNWTGELFNGQKFDFTNAEKVRADIAEFWEYFTREVGEMRIETRGSNLSTGMDISAHGCPIDKIYEQNIIAPPNSPWAPLNYRFGLELAGYMSHIAELPKYGFQMRYYIHDPWWLNSPWFDRYDRSPHDIYLPLSVARLDENCSVTHPMGLTFLSADDSFGRLPDRCPNEVIPHLLSAYNDYPDEAGLVTWIYPFESYCKQGLRDGNMERIFMDDWFIESAIDTGFPINTVISDKNFIKADKAKLLDTILVTPVPEADSALEEALLEALSKGAKVILYGTTQNASEKMRKAIGVELAAPVEGQLKVRTTLPLDQAEANTHADTLEHIALLSGGGICETAIDGTAVHASAASADGERAYVTQNGNLVWIRGSFPHEPWGDLPVQRAKYNSFVPSLLMRSSLSLFGYLITFECFGINTPMPILHFSRCRRSIWLNTYARDNTVRMKMTTPDGAPAFDGVDFILEDNVGTYSMPRWLHTDCCVFVKQKEKSRITVKRDCPHNHMWLDERLVISGLADADVTIYPSDGGTMTVCSGIEWNVVNGTNVPMEWDEAKKCWIVRHITGTLHVCPRDKEHIDDWQKLEFLRDPDGVTMH